MDFEDDCCVNAGFLYAFHVEVNCDCECHDWRDFGDED